MFQFEYLIINLCKKCFLGLYKNLLYSITYYIILGVKMKMFIYLSFFQLGLVEKFYESGQKFLTMFPDGTGNILYPFLYMNYSVI